MEFRALCRELTAVWMVGKKLPTRKKNCVNNERAIQNNVSYIFLLENKQMNTVWDVFPLFLSGILNGQNIEQHHISVA